MTQRAKAVLNDALALPLNERADVAAELLASLDNSAPENPRRSKRRGLRRSSAALERV